MSLTRFVTAFGSLFLSLCAVCSACSGGEPSRAEGMPATDPAAGPSETAPPSSPPRASAAPAADAALADAPPDGPFDYCTAQAARHASCFPTVTFDPVRCKTREACLRVIYHADLDVEGYLRCTSASCSGGGTACLKHISGHTGDQAFADFLAACKTRRDACGDLGPKQFEDACSPFAVMGLRDEVLAERATCLTETCTEIADCMEEKLATRCGL